MSAARPKLETHYQSLAIAAEYDSKRARSLKQRLVRDLERSFFERAVAGSKRVLEIGVGTGEITAAIAPGRELYGVDISDAMLAQAAAKAPSARLRLLDMFRLEELRVEVDAVVSSRVFLHLQPAELRTMLAKASAHVRPDGLIAFDLERPSLWRRAISAMFRKRVPNVPYSRSHIMRLVEESGLELESIEAFDHWAVLAPCTLLPGSRYRRGTLFRIERALGAFGVSASRWGVVCRKRDTGRPAVLLVGNDIHGPLCEMAAIVSESIFSGLALRPRQMISIQSTRDARTGLESTVVPVRRGALARVRQLVALAAAVATLPKRDSRVVHYIGNGNPVLVRTLSALCSLTRRTFAITPLGKVSMPLVGKRAVILCAHEELQRFYSSRAPHRARRFPLLGTPAPERKARETYAGHLLFASVPVRESELEERGLPLLVRAVERAAEAGLCRELTILNRYTHMLEPLDTLARASGAKSTRVFTAIVSDRRAFFREHCLLVAPAGGGHLAQVPQSVLDALSAGVPCVVAAELAIAGDIVRAGAGTTFRDEASFLEGLRSVRERYEEASRAALALASELLSPPTAVEDLRSLYRSLGA